MRARSTRIGVEPLRASALQRSTPPAEKWRQRL